MKCSPLLFSAPMVRALLDGTKTQTRRIIKRPLKHPNWTEYTCFPTSGVAIENGPDYPDDDSDIVVCPYGKPGDSLWVRETWKEAHPLCFQEGRVGERRLDAGIPGPPGVDYLVAYRADGELLPIWHSEEYPWRSTQTDDELSLKHYPKGREAGWMPSIFMPRRASRITLNITELRVEKLHDISTEDAAAEGWPGPDETGTIRSSYPIAWYCGLWESINGVNSWYTNPWVWALTFEVIKSVENK